MNTCVLKVIMIFQRHKTWSEYRMQRYEFEIKIWIMKSFTSTKLIFVFSDEDTQKKCENKETWCEAAKPDCKTDVAKESCPKYCDVCKKGVC